MVRKIEADVGDKKIYATMFQSAPIVIPDVPRGHEVASAATTPRG